MHVLSEVIPIWELEKLTRQYVGFNEHIIKEYYETLKLFHGTDTITNAKCVSAIPLFQWRYPTLRAQSKLKQQYIYNNRIYFDTSLSREELRVRIPLYNDSSIKIKYK